MKKCQRIFLLLTCAAALSSAQTAPDFTVNDIDGNTHHLHSYLDEGACPAAVFTPFYGLKWLCQRLWRNK